MRIFITGATGFIGSYLLRALIKNGHKAMCLKRLTSNISQFADISNQVKWVNNVDDWKEKAIAFKPEAIFNLAWNGVAAKERVIWNIQVSNLALQQDLLDIAKECGTKKFIGIGSQSEYGNFENKIDETFPVNPKTAYAASKVACLDILKSFCQINDIDWYWFRLFPLFGPGESDVWLIPSLIKNICVQDHMDLTPGEQKLSYLYVGECANAIAAAADCMGCSGVYNICCDNPTPLKTLVSKIRDKINPRFVLNFGALEYRYGQCMYMEGDTTALRKNIYDLNTSDFDQRLEETIDYYLNKNGKVPVI